MKSEKEDEKTKPLPFPVQCPSSKDYISGFGPKELVIVLISAGISIILMIVLWIKANELLAVVVAMSIISITFIMTRRNIQQESFIDQLKEVYKYHRAQKQFEYEYYDELKELIWEKNR